MSTPPETTEPPDGSAFWINTGRRAWGDVNATLPLSRENWSDACARLVSFRPLYAALFNELREMEGEVVSPLLEAEGLGAAMGVDPARHGRYFVKCDHELPVGGSVKTRGALYEVVSLADKLARQCGVVGSEAPPIALCSDKCREFFAQYTIVAGSTGNLGMGIGVAARALGFNTVIHMSREESNWKKDRLRAYGVDIRAHDSDYTKAVEAARAAADASDKAFFIDDEASTELFLGYSTAANEVKAQLTRAGICVDEDHPLFVYIPCGVGGAPGGVSFGLKQLFGDNVHCFFAEPAMSACMLLQLSTGSAAPVSVYDHGLDNCTVADGLAVSKASVLTSELIAPIVSGVFTVRDDDLFRWLYLAYEHAGIKAELSAVAGAVGPYLVANTPQGRAYQQANGLTPRMAKATHIIWSTGGLYQPLEKWRPQFARGGSLQERHAWPLPAAKPEAAIAPCHRSDHAAHSRRNGVDND